MTPRTLLTLVCEAELEKEIAADLTTLGASGYTVSDARGHGERGDREGTWSGSRNVRIEVVCSGDLALRLARHFEQRYFEHYAMVLWRCDIEVLRSGKF